jgi:signal recognition particle receptor subunit beta
MKDQEIQTELSSDKIKELEETEKKQSKQIQAKNVEIEGLRNQLSS